MNDALALKVFVIESENCLIDELRKRELYLPLSSVNNIGQLRIVQVFGSPACDAFMSVLKQVLIESEAGGNQCWHIGPGILDNPLSKVLHVGDRLVIINSEVLDWANNSDPFAYCTNERNRIEVWVGFDIIKSLEMYEKLKRVRGLNEMLNNDQTHVGLSSWVPLYMRSLHARRQNLSVRIEDSIPLIDRRNMIHATEYFIREKEILYNFARMNERFKKTKTLSNMKLNPSIELNTFEKYWLMVSSTVIKQVLMAKEINILRKGNDMSYELQVKNARMQIDYVNLAKRSNMQKITEICNPQKSIATFDDIYTANEIFSCVWTRKGSASKINHSA